MPDDDNLEPDGLPEVVLGQIIKDLGPRGEVVADALRTAAHLIVEARQDPTGLRLVESAAYNLRVALEAVPKGQDAADGGFPSVETAYERYRAAASGPEADEPRAAEDLIRELGRLVADGERQRLWTRRFLNWVKERTGIEPLPGDADPAARFNDLRDRASTALHTDSTLAKVTSLYEETISWFVQLFTPPDERVKQIVALARTPYEGPAQMRLLIGEAAYNAHHLGLFLAEVQDPAWLDALWEARLIHPPRDGEPWPVGFLIGGAGGIDAIETARLLERLYDTQHGDPAVALSVARNVIQAALRLGRAGHSLAARIIAKYPSDHWVQMIAVHIAQEAEPSDPIQYAVADAVIGNSQMSDGGHQTRTMIRQLAAGLIPDNAPGRLRMVIAKIARMSREPGMRAVFLDTSALHTTGDELRDPALILAEHLIGMIAAWRSLGLPTSALLELTAPIEGELGERLTCQVLAGASDVDRGAKIAHLARRLASATATGDDRDLLDDLGELTDDEVAVLASAFGEPSEAPKPDEDGVTRLPADWARAWRWSMLLSDTALDRWRESVAAVTEVHGPPDEGSLSRRVPRFLSGRPESPISSDQLTAIAPIHAARLVATWRPGTESGAWGGGVWELASTLEEVIKADVAAWTEDPVAMVTALREPAYIERYLRVLEANAKSLAEHVRPIMEAVGMIRSERWDPSPLSQSRVDPDVPWGGVDQTVVGLIEAFANQRAPFESHLALAWEVASEMFRALPDELPSSDLYVDVAEHDGPYARTINTSYGKALRCAIALGWWEHGQTGASSARLTDMFDDMLDVPGAVGAELRSMVAVHYIVLTQVASAWIDAHHGDLFGGELGEITFEQTLKYARPSPWFYARYRQRLAAAAMRRVENAVSWPLIGYLWDEPGFTIASILSSYSSNTDVLRATAEDIAALVQDVEPGNPMLARALDFWDGMLDAAGSTVPNPALSGAGRWTFVDAITDEAWAIRMDRTLEITLGTIDLPIEVADRCKKLQPSEAGLRMLRLMQGHGEPWEKDHLGRAGLDALRAASGQRVGPEFNRLRDRLIELGWHDASGIPPEPT